ncbi:MAG: hypothetical protein BWX88_02334 [Planctomycetes bacterium ADurb.Bin126]|nr:MAG: hypothetical protein BWX88_02334 [Planctomycetes bacterium ADurb.Bin126]HOD84128.1 hypothetical protein [Phycisphaerae bacterium]HQL75514.1 hypothetical protein [Phycisphaerae bacterium]
MEQAVIVHLPLDDSRFGTQERREALFQLEDELIEAIELAECGEFDGNEFGEGECVFYMYGPDADVIFMVVEVVLKEFPVAHGGFAIKRYGLADDPNAREIRVTW